MGYNPPMRKKEPLQQAEILKLVNEARERSYSPYSRFRVGALAESTSGKLYQGTNVENSSYGLTICAERAALFSMVSSGERDLKTLYISGDKPFTTPCGACLQVISEFAEPDSEIILLTQRSKRVKKLRDLLPLPFKKIQRGISRVG